MVDRFIYNRTSQMITDELTGYRYHGNKEVCKLLNQESERADRNAEKYLAFLTVLDKYGIGSVEKLDQVLLNQRVW